MKVAMGWDGDGFYVKMDFVSFVIMLGFGKSSHIQISYMSSHDPLKVVTSLGVQVMVTPGEWLCCVQSVS